MGLPPPTFTFTIPSIYDATALSCRLYLPSCFSSITAGTKSPRRAAIVAHPYASLGGSYDDLVVENIACALWEDGYIVGTFNFRGAPGSTGHTSWSAKPELADYVSFYGFLLQYMDGLLLVRSEQPQSGQDKYSPLPTVVSPHESSSPTSQYTSRLILAGYSYGAIIGSHLPSMEAIQLIFSQRTENSAISEISSRATGISRQTLEIIQGRTAEHFQTNGQRADAQSRQPSPLSGPLLLGGFESLATGEKIHPTSKRSVEVRRSLDQVRDKVYRKLHPLGRSSEEHYHGRSEEVATGTRNVLICYLLVSPVLPPVSSFATLFSTLSLPGIDVKGTRSRDELCTQPSLAIYGDQDLFTSVKKLRGWCIRLSQPPGSNFQYHEVANAGHFWREPGVLDQMIKHIKQWEKFLGTMV